MPRKIILSLIIAVLVTSFVLISLNILFFEEKSFESSLELIEYKLEHIFQECAEVGKFPLCTDENGQWTFTSSSGWTSGFYPGCLWHLFDWTGKEEWKSRGEAMTAFLSEEQYNTETHDLGFMMYCSYGQGYRLNPNEEYKQILLQSAESLATRYNPSVGCIQSWNRWNYPVIIDNMMNLELLFWAAKNGGDPILYEIAVNHSLNTLKNHIRSDNSTYHVVDYNPVSGEVISKRTWQGYSNESCWARGQAWGIYGFTMVYRETNNTLFLDTAQGLASYFINNLPEDYVPYWDFNAPNIPNEPKDSSAAAITASALFELSSLVLDDTLRNYYFETAYSILQSLNSTSYFSNTLKDQSILKHGVGSYPHNSCVDVGLIFGDYYFLEALLKYQVFAKNAVT